MHDKHEESKQKEKHEHMHKIVCGCLPKRVHENLEENKKKKLI